MVMMDMPITSAASLLGFHAALSEFAITGVIQPEHARSAALNSSGNRRTPASIDQSKRPALLRRQRGADVIGRRNTLRIASIVPYRARISGHRPGTKPRLPHNRVA